MPSTKSVFVPTTFGRDAAKILLDIGAVNFRPQEPYILTSGWASPTYIDCRKLISFTEERRRVIGMAVAALGKACGLRTFDMVAGGETAGIPYAAWVSDLMSLPMLYVRKKPKGFGRNARIEGEVREGANVLLVEDLTTDGGSKVGFVQALREAGATVTDVLVVFYYGAFPGAEQVLGDLGVRLHYLATWQDVLEVAAEGRYFPEDSIAGVREFLADPVGWSAAHGGKAA
ncbi:MAG: orotate phosphoribosyltransferase [Magnetospirillum sp. WYHS-4]